MMVLNSQKAQTGFMKRNRIGGAVKLEPLSAWFNEHQLYWQCSRSASPEWVKFEKKTQPSGFNLNGGAMLERVGPAG
jgi:hypothetical protein